MIVCQNVDKYFSSRFWGKKDIAALSNVSLTLTPGKTHALAGPNGSGKTTLLSCILGLYHPSKGSITLSNLAPQNPKSRLNIGYLPENFSTYADITPAQAISYHYQLSTHKKAPQDLIDKWLTQMDLQNAKHRRIGSFSKGMLQRLGIITSLIHDPELIIWDEPTSGLDPEGRKLTLDLLQEEKSRGKTILISSHILSDIDRCCEHLFVIRNGSLKMDADIQEALSRTGLSSVEELYPSTTSQRGA